MSVETLTAIKWLVAFAAIAGLIIGYLIGLAWGRVRESEAYDEGRLHGFMEGYDRQVMVTSKVLHDTTPKQ